MGLASVHLLHVAQGETFPARICQSLTATSSRPTLTGFTDTQKEPHKNGGTGALVCVPQRRCGMVRLVQQESQVVFFVHFKEIARYAISFGFRRLVESSAITIGPMPNSPVLLRRVRSRR